MPSWIEKHVAATIALTFMLSLVLTEAFYTSIPIGILNLPVCGTALNISPIYIFQASDRPANQSLLLEVVTPSFPITSGRYPWVSNLTYTTGQIILIANSQSPTRTLRFQAPGSVSSTLPVACFQVGLISGYV